MPTDDLVEVKPFEREALDKRLAALEGGLKNQALVAGLREAQKPVAARIKRDEPELTGYLKKSIGTKVMSARQKRRYGVPRDEQAVIAGPVKKVLKGRDEKGVEHYVTMPDYRKAYLIEYGTKRGKRFKENPSGVHIQKNQIMLDAKKALSSRVENLFYRGLSAWLDDFDAKYSV